MIYPWGRILPTPSISPWSGEDWFVRILRVLLEVLPIVFLYNYAVHLLYKKSWDGYNFYCMLKQAETDVQSTSNRKLPNFYEKVTDFLLESYRISKWWQNHLFTETCRICHIWRILTRWMMWLFMQANWLFMQKMDWQTKHFLNTLFVVETHWPMGSKAKSVED